LLQKVGDLSYKLQLLTGLKLHPVSHVSQLCHGAPVEEVHSELPQVTDEVVPLGLPASLATWENIIELKARFPRALAWGQAAGKGGENVICPTGKDLKMGLDHDPADSSGPTHATQPTNGLLKSAKLEMMAIIKENI
jgi:hypothetical protein